MKKIAKILTVTNILILTFLFLLYGPITYFKDLLITTALETKSYSYIARVFYSQKTIDKVIEKNKLQDIDEDTDTEEIDPSEEISLTEYDKEILDREEGTIYKIIEVTGPTYKGYMAVIYDPARISLGISGNLGSGGQFIKTIANKNEALLAINASGFEDKAGVVTGGYATGAIIRNNEVIWEGPGTGWPGGIVGFDNNNVLTLTKKTPQEAVQAGMKNAIEFGPFLIVNGKEAEVSGNGGYGLAPRTAIGQRKDGIVLLLVIDGRQPGHSIGADMSDLIDVFKKYGAHNASNLDGGASTTMYSEGKFINQQNYDRAAPNAWIVK